MPTFLLRRRRWALAIATATVTLGASAHVRAADKAVKADRADKKECVAAYEEGQRLRKESKLGQARDRLLVCAQDACPVIVRRDCTQWVVEIEQSTPTLVLEAVGAGGHDLFDVRVSLDGKPVGDRIEGKALSVDPGPHVVRFEMAGRPPIEEKVLAREGEKNRRVVARFDAVVARGAEAPAAPAAAPPPARKVPTPAAVYVLGGVGALGLGTFAYFGALGMAAKGDLDARGCKPDCPSSEVERAKRRFIIADVGLGLGIAAVGLATVLYFTRGEATPSAPALSAWKLDVTPTRGGAAAAVSGSF